MKLRDEPQTMTITFQEICQGQDPWVPLGNFMDMWLFWTYGANGVGPQKGRRQILIVEPIADATPGYERWAAFCAATVEWFCNKYGEPCPAWVHDAKYILPEPWINDPYGDEAPECFKKRNIFCGSERRLFMNKYEIHEQVAAILEIKRRRAEAQAQ